MYFLKTKMFSYRITFKRLSQEINIDTELLSNLYVLYGISTQI